MSFFEKLANFTQKSKDAATRQAILAKDKRLEKSMSDELDPGKMGMFKMATFGLPDAVSVAAFDPVTGLLAVAGGTENSTTFIRVFGKGLVASLSLQTSAPIKFLQFKTGCPLLVAVDTTNIIVIYDLKSKQACHAITAPATISCIEYCTGTDWLFIGFADGNVDVLDLDTGTFADYGIADLNEEENNVTHTVLTLRMHPTDLNLLLVGYENSVFLWDIREQMLKREFILHNRDARLTCLAWSPCGQRFMVGCDDGYLHFWDSRTDSRPLFSRRVFQAFPSGSGENVACDPISQLAWYVAENKSYLVVIGGSELPDLHGLHVLLFDLEGDVREARKQTILPTDMAVTSFILLSRDPYFVGMNDPLGVLVIGCDGSVAAYGLDHGMPLLSLPPALDMLHPRLQKAIHVTALDNTLFEKIITPHQQQHSTRYLPLTGGVAGDAHVYRIPSNDLLITTHTQNIVKFWDASFTSLRPLPHLTLQCRIGPDTEITFVTLDAHHTSLIVAFDSGALVVYTLQEPPEVPANTVMETQRLTHEQIIENSDNTLKELEDILNDIQQLPESELTPVELSGDSPPPLPPRSSAAPSIISGTDKDSDVHSQETESHPVTRSISPPPLEKNDSEKRLIDIELLQAKATETMGFAARLKLTLRHSSPIQLATVRNNILAFSTLNGQLFVVDTRSHTVILATHIQPDPTITNHQQPETPSPTAHIQDSPQATSPDTPQVAPQATLQDSKPPQETNVSLPGPISVTCLTLCPSYSSSDLKRASLQLYVGLSNGVVIQYTLSAERPSDAGVTVSCQQGSIVDIQLVDLQGVVPTEALENDVQRTSGSLSRKSTSSSASKEDSVASPTETPLSLLRKTTLKFTKSKSQRSAAQSSAPPVPPPPLPPRQGVPAALGETAESPVSPPTPTSGRQNSGPPPLPKRTKSNRVEYQQQDDPHMLITVSTQSIDIILSGYNVELFHTGLEDINAQGDAFVHGKVAHTPAGSCFIAVLQSGLVVVYTLPSLTPITTFTLHYKHQIQQVSQTNDGRLLVWSGKYELQQFTLLLQNNLPFGEAVLLSNPHQIMPPHPQSRIQAQKPKKSWLDTMQGAFQKAPLTVGELDKIMGRTQEKKPEPTPVRQPSMKSSDNAQAAKPADTSSGPGGVFKELSDKMNERGERLNELSQKFSELNDASGDFLKAIREYNERQARKKWYEF